MDIDPERTARVIVDPLGDFLSPESVVWDLVGEQVEKNEVVRHLVALKEAAERTGIPVFYSPHVIVVKDATAGAGEQATQAAYVNYGFIASEVVTTTEALEALEAAAPVRA